MTAVRVWVFALLAMLLAGCPVPEPGMDASIDASLDARGCALSAECDDGRYCNGIETCEGGRCTPGTAPECDDGIACTTDSCSEARRGCENLPTDLDGDGYGAVGCAGGNDCDDTDPDAFVGNLERCDAEGHDEDCDPSTRGGIDDDLDGYESVACCNGADCGNDCDDARPNSNPAGIELCNGLDDDCDGSIDEGVRVAGFLDADRDGYGDSTMPTTACEDAVGFSVQGGDCDDTPGTGISRSPGQPEICDGLDNDCDPNVDEETSDVAWFVDADHDGFGSRSSGPVVLSCTPIAGRVLNDHDCDDRSSSFSPRAPELCNGIDDDCNGLADFAIEPGNLEDDDRDGIADLRCGGALGRDCDDQSASVGPGEAETCDGRDNDCDTRIDEDASSAVFYRDADGDGYGSIGGGLVVGCAPPLGYVGRGGDCDDTDASRSPRAAEICNGRDQDCDGAVDEDSAALCPGGVCRLGACRDPMCAIDRANCDGSFDNGCETNVATSSAHCGGCGRLCAMTGATAATCSAGACSLTCMAGRDDCDGVGANGCEADLFTDVRNCGSCGRSCEVATGDTFRCDASVCTVSMCRAGRSDCDGDPSNGCETAAATCPSCGPLARDCNADGVCVDLSSREDHCGACGHRCELGSTCVGGTCDRAVEIDVNVDATCIRFEQGNVVCWGTNVRGSLGQVNTPSYPGARLEVWLAGERATEVAMGGESGCAIVSDGSVRCWGSNTNGLLGVAPGTLAMSADPVSITGLGAPALHIAMSRSYACALLADHSLWCWGRNVSTTLDGNGTAADVLGPTEMTLYPEGSALVSSVAVGEFGICGVGFDDEEVYCVGGLPNASVSSNGNGRIVLGLPASRLLDLNMGSNAACARYASGEVWCWGGNDSGVLGRGSPSAGVFSAARATEFLRASDSSVAQWTSCAIDAAGTLRCVGDNQYAMSGDAGNLTNAAASAVAVPGFAPGTLLARSGNASHLCALDPSGRAWCWGANDAGQCGVRTPAVVRTPTPAGGL